MITFDHVTVSFGDFTALPDFSLTINTGEFFTFLGPSGCGKTTALRTLAGLNPTAAGTITIDGRDVTRTPCDKRGIGMVFQNYALFPSMTVRDNIGFGLKQKKLPADQIAAAVDDMAAIVELSHRQLGRTVSELSGGQQQRVAIARALVTEPDILLLDEPLSNLDAKLREQLRVQLKDLQQRLKVTTVYVTHDQEEALCLSDRIAVMNAGRIEMLGTPEEVYERSATEFVCRFIGRANKLSPQLAHYIADNTADFINPELTCFIRVEKIHPVTDDATGGPDTAIAPATVIDRAYYGLTSYYRLDCLGTQLTMAASETGVPRLTPGDTIRIAIPADKVLQYPVGADNADTRESR